MNSHLGKIVTASAAKQIANDIRQAILDGRLKVDERLPTEGELAQHFDVSRPTIREALKRLAAENLIWSRRGPTGGNFVKMPSREEVTTNLTNAMTLLVSLGDIHLEEITDARLELELSCSRLACDNRTEAELAAMRAEIDIQRDPNLGDVEFCASDVRFHRELVKAAHNPILQILVTSVLEGLQPITNLIVFRFRDRAILRRQHQQILDAVEARDADAADAAIREQMTYLRERYTDAIDWRERCGRGHRPAPRSA